MFLIAVTEHLTRSHSMEEAVYSGWQFELKACHGGEWMSAGVSCPVFIWASQRAEKKPHSPFCFLFSSLLPSPPEWACAATSGLCGTGDRTQGFSMLGKQQTHGATPSALLPCFAFSPGHQPMIPAAYKVLSRNGVSALESLNTVENRG